MSGKIIDLSQGQVALSKAHLARLKFEIENAPYAHAVDFAGAVERISALESDFSTWSNPISTVDISAEKAVANEAAGEEAGAVYLLESYSSSPNKLIPRYSIDDYAHAMSGLLPLGDAWNRSFGSIMQAFVKGLAAIYLYVNARLAQLLEVEADPRFSDLLLSDWENDVGLPDPCLRYTSDKEKRRRQVVAKLKSRGGAHPDYFIQLAAALGYEIKIQESQPFACGISPCGDSGHRLYYPLDTKSSDFDYFEAGLGACGEDALYEFNGDKTNFKQSPLDERHAWEVIFDVGTTRLFPVAKTIIPTAPKTVGVGYFRCGESECGAEPPVDFDYVPPEIEYFRCGETECGSAEQIDFYAYSGAYYATEYFRAGESQCGADPLFRRIDQEISEPFMENFMRFGETPLWRRESDWKIKDEHMTPHPVDEGLSYAAEVKCKINALKPANTHVYYRYLGGFIT